ncbi:hypothetical protein Pan216_03170 [Planctomycetes bacterium Pan216]|uniref:Carboxypeptidase regulatory-like domain-containing protein n=1 Tax=Kolteria novifilia TaxID=2527975 RepID=A0A518AXN3_9BACT|nr:hypothetical protein Pan216_03170 [Planctomycetes bacterium Pan216]
MFARLTMIAVLLGLVPIVGCSGNSEGRVAVSGKVTLDGQPLEQGVVRFNPVGGGLVGEGEINGGSYSLGTSNGPTPGPKEVSIVSLVDTGKTQPDEFDPMKKVPLLEQIIPPRYNQATELKIDVGTSGGTFDFDLKKDAK